jgi:hypothetical protein
MDLRESIREILSDKKTKKEGLHVKHLANHIINENKTLFSDDNDLSFDVIKKRIIRILANDVKKKRNSEFIRVKNPKTNKFRKGVYKLKTIRRKSLS